jgi:hypothetical protein
LKIYPFLKENYLYKMRIKEMLAGTEAHREVKPPLTGSGESWKNLAEVREGRD